MKFKENTKQGSITLEAALFLPIFVLAVLTIGYFIKIAAINENVSHTTIDEANRLATRAYGIKVEPSFPKRLEQRLAEENTEGTEFAVSKYRYLYRDVQTDGLISFTTSGNVDLHMPLGFGKVYVLESRLKCRGFIGKKAKGPPMPFEEMEESVVSDKVWIFPMWGKRFHSETCTYVQANPTQMVLCAELRRQYEPCHLCKPKSLPTGTLVYCFLRAGQAYHKGDCSTIEKYTIVIERKDAIRKGYSPCSKCGGG